MKTMLANLNAIVGDTLTDSIQMIDIDELHESEDNFFAIDRIEEFAETILGQGGVKDNLIVRPLEDGGYEIISGHRRKVAVQYLLDNGENVSETGSRVPNQRHIAKIAIAYCLPNDFYENLLRQSKQKNEYF